MNAPEQVATQLIRLNVNGAVLHLAAAPAQRLSTLLRDELKLTGTKIGCHAGDCGACTVLLDGQPVCACLVAAGQCAGRSITTVEGLAQADGTLSRLQQAFRCMGAAQCGICTPGMLMSAQALLQHTPQPSEVQVQDALAGVLCRCTGYRLIIDAVLLAAGTQAITFEAPAAGQAVGARLPRLDANAKLRGTEAFGADTLPASWPQGGVSLRIIRSPHAHARFTLGSVAGWLRHHPGVLAVFTAADVPNNAFAIFANLRDQPVLADGLVRFAGEAVLALAGDEPALLAIDERELPIHYERLNALAEMHQALAHGAPAVHAAFADNVLCRGRVVRGKIEPALAQAAHRAEAGFETRAVEHAYIEPEAGWAELLTDTEPPRLRVFASTQTPYMDRDELAHVLGWAPERIHIVPSAVGGGFGGKLDLAVQPLLAIAACKLKRPVRLVYERPESMRSSTKRHPARMRAAAACDAQGRLTAFDFQGDFNTGAYSSWGPTVANRVPIHACGPYRVPHVRALTCAVFTHGSVAGAFRGFGVPQATLLGELLIDELAAASGADALEFRHQNALRAGDHTATGQVLHASVGLQACLVALRPAWAQALARCKQHNTQDTPRKRGAGIACMWYGIGNTVIANPSTVRGSLRLNLEGNAELFLYNGAQEIGQGTATILPQIFADAVGLPVACVEQVMGDTDLTLDAGKSSASRQTFVSGQAARLAGLDLRAQLLEALGVAEPANLRLEGSALFAHAGGLNVCLDLIHLPRQAQGDVFTGQGRFDPPTVALDADGQGVPYATYAFAAQIAEVEVDVELGTVKLLHIHAAHDVGRAINPTLVEGQIHGGIAQGIGMALMEEYVNGRTDNLHDYLIPTVGDVPPITVHLIEDPEPLGPWGAKGVGEPALVATAPAILAAIRHATGVKLHEVPVTPSRLRAALLELK